MTRSPLFERAAWWLAVAAVVTVPLFVSLRGAEDFRLPKDALFLMFGLILAAVVIAAAPAFRRVTQIALAAVVWTAIATLFSANRTISAATLVWVVAAAAFAIAVDVGGRARSPRVIAIPLIPAALNAVVFLLQRFHIWNPMRFPPDVPDHFRFTALIGNPDDVGSFLVAPAIVAVALAVTDRARRALWVPASALLLLAIATGRLTSLIACGAAMLTIGFLRSRRAAIVATIAVVAGAIVLVAGYAPMRERATAITTALRAHDYAEATAGRVTPFLAAANMAKDHPLFGIGPGCFGFEYFPYKVAVERAHPSLRKAYSAVFSYGEAHNDHLQTLAETGVIGFAILIAAIVVLARASRGDGTDGDLRGEVARTIALPLAIAVTILCLAHFPLHLSAATVVLLFVAALCVSWRAPDIASAPQPHVVRYAVAGVAAIVAVFVIARFAWSPFSCNERKPGLTTRTDHAVNVIDHYRAAVIARDNLEAIDSCIAADPSDVDFYMLAAANHHVLGRDDDAVAMYRRALSWDRRPELYYNVGLLELGMNRRAQAMADLRNAAEFNANYINDLPADVRDELTASLR